MNQDGQPVDFLFRWKDPEQRRATEQDSVSVADDELEPVEAGELEPGPDPAEASADELVAETPPVEADDGTELFEWSAEREQALLDALQQTPEGAPARVHAQLETIVQALEAGGLSPERADLLLGEVESYLDSQIDKEQRKIPVAHEAFLQSRADKLKALFAWQESAAALREYLEHGEAVQLKVAVYAAEQGSAFLAAAREVLLAAEPELD